MNYAYLEIWPSVIYFCSPSSTETTQEQETETVEKTPRNNQEKQYRINSPSYREVQNAVVEFEKFRSSLPGCSNWMSPEASGSSSAPLGKATISNEMGYSTWVFTNKYDFLTFTFFGGLNLKVVFVSVF